MDGDGTDFDQRQGQRRRVLERVALAARVLFIVYLAAHGSITWQAYVQEGAIAALLTFVLLGFGDLYWALRWIHQEAYESTGLVALATAGACFASWILRPRFDAWMMAMTSDMLRDFSEEIDRRGKDDVAEADADEASAGVRSDTGVAGDAHAAGSVTAPATEDPKRPRCLDTLSTSGRRPSHESDK